MPTSYAIAAAGARPFPLSARPCDSRQMMNVVVLGAGGHAKVVIEALRAAGRYHVVGCIAPAGSIVLDVPVLGSDDMLPELRARGLGHAIVAMGSNDRRLALGERLLAMGFDLATAIHPAANISPSARIGRGVAVLTGAVINAEAEIGDHAIVNTLAVVEHGCIIGEAAHVAPRAALGGDAVLGRLSLLGIGASVVPGRRIGNQVVVGAGAAVTGNLGDRVTAVGVPARVIKSTPLTAPGNA